MINCKNCGELTNNNKFCSRLCMIEYKFLHSRKKRSKLEKYFYEELKKRFPKLKIKKNDRKTLDLLELDLYFPLLNIAIEFQGIQHYKFVKYFHRNIDNFNKQVERDKHKKKLCEEKNILLVEIDNSDKFSIKSANDKLEWFINEYLSEYI